MLVGNKWMAGEAAAIRHESAD